MGEGVPILGAGVGFRVPSVMLEVQISMHPELILAADSDRVRLFNLKFQRLLTLSISKHQTAISTGFKDRYVRYNP